MGGLRLRVVEFEPAGDGGSADGGGEEDVLAPPVAHPLATLFAQSSSRCSSGNLMPSAQVHVGTRRTVVADRKRDGRRNRGDVFDRVVRLVEMRHGHPALVEFDPDGVAVAHLQSARTPRREAGEGSHGTQERTMAKDRMIVKGKEALDE